MTIKSTMHSCLVLVALSILLGSIGSVLAADEILTNDSYVVENGMYMVDTDCGTDDAMALIILLKAEQKHYNTTTKQGPRVLAITTVNGNTGLDNVTLNVLKVLNMTGRLDIPVYRGAEDPLMDSVPLSNYFGSDGFGDVPWVNPPSRDLLQKEHAVVAMLRLVNQYPGQITLLTLGPLTNVALAARLNPKFISQLKRLVIMGGAAEGVGNIKPGVEFNFYVDPIANYVVFEGSEYENDKIYLLPWETVVKLNITKKWRQKELGAIDSVTMKFLNAAEMNTKGNASVSWTEADPVAASLALSPTLATKLTRHHIVTVTQGSTQGGIFVDHYNSLPNESQVNIYLEVDKKKYKTFLLNSLS